MLSSIVGLLVGLITFGCLASAKRVCYGKYGCFSDEAPFDTKILSIFPRKLPQPPGQMEAKFFLFTRDDRIGQTILDDSDVNKLEESSYDGSKRTYFIIHGWTGKPLESPWVKDMKDVLLQKEDANVFISGWQQGASDIYYPQAVGNSRLVGAMVAQFIKFLNDQTQNTPESFHVIGFSLGGQVSGYAGKRYREITGQMIGRITGLDPASPGYKDEHIDVRLDETDGAFVDVIHSDCPRVGTPSKSGKFDFWPNGGGSQPGCKIKKKSAVDKAFELVGCEHYRAHQYFIESIKQVECSFRAYRCPSWKHFTRGKCLECGKSGSECPEMGFNAYNSKDLQGGNFYLYTNAQPPYCVPRMMKVTFETGANALHLGDGYNPIIRIRGSKTSTGEINLKGKLPENSNEVFIAPIKEDLGNLESVEVKNDLTLSPADPWKVNKVTLQYIDSNDSFSACYNTNVYRSFNKKTLRSGNGQCKRKQVIKTPQIEKTFEDRKYVEDHERPRKKTPRTAN